MKKLYLMRHATSDWPKHIQTDIERPLTSHGEVEAELMANRLKNKKAEIDLMLISKATRTQETSKFIIDSVSVKMSMVTKEIYETTHEHLLEVIQDLPDDVDSLMILAHNPSISMLTTVLLGTYADLPPAVLVEIDFDVESWRNIDRGSVTHEHIEVPSMFL
jgi:phosphohistidine phosphatase